MHGQNFDTERTADREAAAVMIDNEYEEGMKHFNLSKIKIRVSNHLVREESPFLHQSNPRLLESIGAPNNSLAIANYVRSFTCAELETIDPLQQDRARRAKSASRFNQTSA